MLRPLRGGTAARRRWIGLLVLFVLFAAATRAVGQSSSRHAVVPGFAAPPRGSEYQLAQNIGFRQTQVAVASPGVTRPLRTIPTQQPAVRATTGELEAPHRPTGGTATSTKDPVLQRSAGAAAMPDPVANFDGQSYATAPWASVVPDTNGAIGPNHYVQIVNNSFEIFSPNGIPAYGPQLNEALFTDPPCSARPWWEGDPIILYDQFAGRWLASFFSWATPDGPNYECIAISRTSDPTGSWCAYNFVAHDTLRNDYPKLGVWPSQNAYFMTALQWTTDSATSEGIWAFERDRMLACEPARRLYHHMQGSSGVLALPADADGMMPPPAGAPIPLVAPAVVGQGSDLAMWEGAADWETQTLTVKREIDLAPAEYREGGCGCIAQPGTDVHLSASGGFLMNRLAYRNFGAWESLTFNRSVGAPEGEGVRWFELLRAHGKWSVRQQGTFAPDDVSRWMGSVAMDHNGDIGAGYSVSSASVYPGVRYAGRLSSDPIGELAQGEGTLVAGGGSQTGHERWGDYSSLTVDPTDDCTFWFTTEYYAATSANQWRTRVGAFRFPASSCSLGLRTLLVTTGGHGHGKVTASSGAIDCGSVCEGAYGTGTRVSLAAHPSTRSRFVGWSGGGCRGARACSLTMDGNRAVTATFGPVLHCVVPRLAGRSLVRAKRLIVKAHCRVGKISKRASRPELRGRVLSQSPRPGRRLGAGAKVRLTVGLGPPA